MTEKRDQERHYLRYYMQVDHRKNNAEFGYLVNLTEDGVMIVTKNPVEVGHKFEFSLITPQGFDNGERIDFDAECVWCGTDPVKSHLFAAGFTLQEIYKHEPDIIAQIIHKFGLPSIPYRD